MKPAVEGTIVVFAKCPIPGKSKTRLSTLLGENGSALLAKAMLSDVLTSLTMDVSIGEPPYVQIFAIHVSTTTALFGRLTLT